MKNCYVNKTIASKILGYSVKTITRLVEDARLPIHRASNGSQARIWVYDLHSAMLFNKPFQYLNEHQKNEVRFRVNEQ